MHLVHIIDYCILLYTYYELKYERAAKTGCAVHSTNSHIRSAWLLLWLCFTLLHIRLCSHMKSLKMYHLYKNVYPTQIWRMELKHFRIYFIKYLCCLEIAQHLCVVRKDPPTVFSFQNNSMLVVNTYIIVIMAVSKA